MKNGSMIVHVHSTFNVRPNGFNDDAKWFRRLCKTLLMPSKMVLMTMQNGFDDATFIFSCGQKLCQKIFDYQS